MKKRQLASLVVAGTVLLGAGAALAETAPSGPTATDGITTTIAGDTTTTMADTPTTEATTDTTEATTDTTEATTDATGSADPAAENHGAVVSAAAHDHSHDAECGNHGKYVSAIAHGETGCVTPSATQGHKKTKDSA